MGERKTEDYRHEFIRPNETMEFRLTFSIDTGSVVNKHFHDWLEIVYLVRGTLEFYDNNTARLLKENEFAVVNPMSIHSTRCTEGNTAILLQLPMELLERVMPDIRCFRFRVEEEGAYENDPEKQRAFLQLRDILKELWMVYMAEEEGRLFHLYSMVYSLIFLLIRFFSLRVTDQIRLKSEKNMRRMQQVMEYIGAHYREPLPLEKAAGEAGLNPVYFSRFFKEQAGISYLEYVNMVRLEHIYTDLRNTDLPIREIQERHGLYNDKMFRRLFRQAYGCTPQEARKKTEGR